MTDSPNNSNATVCPIGAVRARGAGPCRWRKKSSETQAGWHQADERRRPPAADKRSNSRLRLSSEVGTAAEEVGAYNGRDLARFPHDPILEAIMRATLGPAISATEAT